MRRLWNSSPVRFIRDFINLYFSARVSRSAAELAYFLILSFFPALICVNAFVSALQLDLNQISQIMSSFLPKSVSAILTDYIQYITTNRSVAMTAAGVSVMVVSASAAVRALMKIMDDINGSVKYPGVWGVFISVAFSVLLLVTIYMSMLVVLTGSRLFRFVERLLGLEDRLSSWHWLLFLLLFALVLLFILLLYRITTPVRSPRQPVLVGSLLASVTLAAASGLFSWMMSLSSRYSLVYGSLASVIIMLVWLYLCGHILILGNTLNYILYRNKTRPPKLDQK